MSINKSSKIKELDGPVSARFGVRSRKFSNVGQSLDG
jgi:hypothetical protein